MRFLVDFLIEFLFCSVSVVTCTVRFVRCFALKIWCLQLSASTQLLVHAHTRRQTPCTFFLQTLPAHQALINGHTYTPIKPWHMKKGGRYRSYCCLFMSACQLAGWSAFSSGQNISLVLFLGNAKRGFVFVCLFISVYVLCVSYLLKEWQAYTKVRDDIAVISTRLVILLAPVSPSLL